MGGGTRAGARTARHDLDLERVCNLDVAAGLLADHHAKYAWQGWRRVLRLAPRAREVVGDVDEDKRVQRQREGALVGHGRRVRGTTGRRRMRVRLRNACDGRVGRTRASEGRSRRARGGAASAAARLPGRGRAGEVVAIIQCLL